MRRIIVAGLVILMVGFGIIRAYSRSAFATRIESAPSQASQSP